MKKTIKKQQKYLFRYRCSSLPGFINKRHRYQFIQYHVVLDEYAGDNQQGRAAYKTQIIEDLGQEIILKDKVVGLSLLGSDSFVLSIKKVC